VFAVPIAGVSQTAPVPRAVVIGSGPNGLAGAVVLAQAGWEVEVHEAEATLGGATRTEELTLPGFRHDVCSAVHPLGRSSPFFRRLDLELEWVDPPAPAAHPFEDGTAVVLERDVDETAAGLGADACAYRRLLRPYVEAYDAVEPLLVGGFPPQAHALTTALLGLGPRALARGLRTAFGAARPAAESLFETARARSLFAGLAAHSILPLERRPSAGFGLTLAVLGHAVGWPSPRGGAQAIADSLADRLRALGATIHLSSPIDELPRADAVLADVTPRELLRLARGRFPERYARELKGFRHGPGAFKLDWALDGPIPWAAAACARAGTVHLGATLEEISRSERAAWTGAISERPFVLLGQQSLFDPTRAPAGKHTAWAYCHVPPGSELDVTERIESQVERFAPGFRRRILARSVLDPARLEARNRNLVGGDVNGGAMDLGQLFFRPARRLVPYRTPLRGVYICSSSTPPGGGVHGMCGEAAARVALADARKRV